MRSVFCRVTAQRSQEDAEEVERERRRRSREKERGERSPSCSESPLQGGLAYNTESVFVHITVVLHILASCKHCYCLGSPFKRIQFTVDVKHFELYFNDLKSIVFID